MKKKVLFLTNAIPPYMHDLFNNLAGYDEIDFEVCALVDKEPNRKWSMDFLNNAAYKYQYFKRYYVYSGFQSEKDIFI